MVYKVLIAIDWENINTGNKTKWEFIEKYPPKSVNIVIFHYDLKKSVTPIFPRIPVTYEPTPKLESFNGSKNSTDRHMMRTILKKVLDENYNEVVIVSDDKIFDILKSLLEQIKIPTTIEYSDIHTFRKHLVVERIFELLEESPATLEDLQNRYHKKYNHNLVDEVQKQVNLSLKDTLNKLIAINAIYIIQDETLNNNKYTLHHHTENHQLQEGEIEENISDVIQILYNKHPKGHELDRSTLFNTIKGNTIFSDKFNSKTIKDKLIQKLIEKNILLPVGQKYILQ